MDLVPNVSPARNSPHADAFHYDGGELRVASLDSRLDGSTISKRPAIIEPPMATRSQESGRLLI
jgi:hypothetical protein